jgi:hypothetical protein
LHGKRGDAARRADTKVAQDFLALVLVNFHEITSRSR